MTIHIHFSHDKTKYETIYESLKHYILSGQLCAHERLPAKRTFASQLHISVHTVQIAYEQLVSEGYIYAKQRAGYFVSPFDEQWQQSPTQHVQQHIRRAETMRYNLKNGQVDEQHFPVKQWQKLSKQVVEQFPIRASHWQGELALREQIAHYVQLARGIHCDASQIFICSGTQHQLDLLCTFFGNVHVAIEEPGFFRATTVFKQHALAIDYVPVDDHGATIPSTDVQLYYVTPAHQFPLGHVMPLERKTALLTWATAHDAYIIEDDYDAEFRYKGLPIPPLAQLDQLQRVIYFGTFSKTVMPSLRMSYMILPQALVAPFQAYFHAQKSTVSRIEQLVLANFIAEGHFVRHIDKMRTLYRKKHARLVAALQATLPPSFRIFGADAGLHIIVELPHTLDEQTAIAQAASCHVAIDAISMSYVTQCPTQFVMIGFGAIAYEEIDEAVERLATCWTHS